MKPQNEKTRQKAGFSEISKAAKTTFETLYGAGTRSRTRDLLITSQLLYQLSYTGVMGCEYIASDALVNPSCLIQLKKLTVGAPGGMWAGGGAGRFLWFAGIGLLDVCEHCAFER